MGICLVCGERTEISEHKVNEVEQKSNDQFLIMLICKKCRIFHEKYISVLKTLGYETDKLNPHGIRNFLFEMAYFMGKIKQKKVIALYGKGDKLPSDYGISYIPIDKEGDWKFIIKREMIDIILSNMEKIH